MDGILSLYLVHQFSPHDGKMNGKKIKNQFKKRLYSQMNKLSFVHLLIQNDRTRTNSQDFRIHMQNVYIFRIRELVKSVRTRKT